MMGVAVLAFTSCLNDTVTETNTGRPIDFRVSADTRATETTTENLTTFYVTSLMENGSAYFEDLAFIRGSENVYMSTPAYYWPATGNLDFYAYAPAIDELGGELTISSTAKTLEGFSPAYSIVDQKDFVVAKASGNKTENAAGVALNFNHMLTQIEIHAKNAHDGYTYLVKGVSINDVVSTADFDFTTCTWTLGEETTDYTVNYAYPVELTATGEVVMNLVNIDGDEFPDNAMLLPQNLKYDAPDAKIGLYVQCKSKSGAQIFPESGDYDWMYVDIDTDWLAGYRYVYTVDLTRGSEDFTQIQFTMDVTDWGEKSTLNDEEIDITGTWRMARIEETDSYENGQVNKYIYDTEDEILDHLADRLYIVKVTSSDMYYTSPGTPEQDFFYYKIEGGELKVQFEKGEPYVDGYLIRDISENFVTYTQIRNITNSLGEVVGKTEAVFYYVRIDDVDLYEEPVSE